MEYILGVIVSLIVQKTKKYSVNTYVTLLLISVGASLGYFLLNQYGYWTTLAQILITAGAFHNFIIRRVEEK